MKKWPYKRGGLSLGEQFTSFFYYLSATEIWPNNRDGLWWEWPSKRGYFCSDIFNVYYYYYV